MSAQNKRVLKPKLPILSRKRRDRNIMNNLTRKFSELSISKRNTKNPFKLSRVVNEKSIISEVKHEGIYKNSVIDSTTVFTGLEYKSISFEDILFIKCEFTSADKKVFKNCNFMNCVFESCYFTHVTFDNCKFDGCRFEDTIFMKAIFIVPFTLNSKPTPGGREFRETSVPLHWANNPVHTVHEREEHNLIGCEFKHVRFEDCNFNNIIQRKCIYEHVVISNTQCKSHNINDSTFKHVHFKKMHHTSFTKCMLDSCTIIDSATGIDFNESNLKSVSIVTITPELFTQLQKGNYDLSGAKQGCVIELCNFNNSQLENINFMDCEIILSKFNNINLRGIKFGNIIANKSSLYTRMHNRVIQKVQRDGPKIKIVKATRSKLNVKRELNGLLYSEKVIFDKLEDIKKITRTNWTNCDMEDVEFNNAFFSNCELSSCKLINAKFLTCILVHVYFYKCDLTHSNFSHAMTIEIRFNKSNLSYANFKDASLTNLNFNNCTLINSNFNNADLRIAELKNTDLSNAVMTNANMKHVMMKSVLLRNANLSMANLTDSIFELSILNYAHLDFANLTRANLINAVLTGTTLTNADLTNTNFTNANLQDADMSGVKITNAIFNGANATGVKLDNGVALAGSIILPTANRGRRQLGGNDVMSTHRRQGHD